MHQSLNTGPITKIVVSSLGQIDNTETISTILSLFEVGKGTETFWRRSVQAAAGYIFWDLRHFPHSFHRGQTGEQEHRQTQGGRGETGTHGGTAEERQGGEGKEIQSK